MKIELPHARRPRRQAAFTLVEVALSLGIAGFVLAGLIGAIPLASDVGRQSITQTRAASIASTLYTNLRAQSKFNAASLLDDGSDALKLDEWTTSSDPVVYYAYFDEAVTIVPGNNEARRLHFVLQPPAGVAASNPIFQVTLRFNNHPAGTLSPYAVATVTTHAQANAIEVSIHATARPKDVYRFSSVIANRAE